MLSLCLSLFHNYYNGYYRLLSLGDYDLDTLSNIKIVAKIFRMPLFLVLSLIGIFIKNKIGWVLVTLYFYFLSVNFCIELYESIPEFDTDYLLVFIPMLILPVFLLYQLNKKVVYFDHFKVEKNKLVLFNVIAFGIGLLFSTILFLWKNEHLIMEL